MAKKLFVPERGAANMKSDTPQTKIPTAIEKALPEQEENKNTENPENPDNPENFENTKKKLQKR